MTSPTTYRELAEEFEWTRSRHEGRVSLAAPIFDCTPHALAQRLRRAKAAGIDIRWIDDLRRTKP